jgi:hypothetical protein
MIDRGGKCVQYLNGLQKIINKAKERKKERKKVILESMAVDSFPLALTSD